MQIKTHEAAVVIVDPNRANAIVEVVAGPFANYADAEREYNALRDANDDLFDATGDGWIWYAVRYVETTLTIADADFADDSDASDDRPAEALGAGTFSARLAAYVEAERAASAPAAESFVTDYSAPADSVFELRAAELVALGEVNRYDAELDDAARRCDSDAYGVALAAKRAAFEVYYAARLAREAVAPNRAVFVKKVATRRYILRYCDTFEMLGTESAPTIGAARELAERYGVHVSYVDNKIHS